MLRDTILVSFSGSQVHEKLQLELDSLYKDLFFRHEMWNKPRFMETDFYKQNQKLFKYEKYFGYFAWKPYIIEQSLLDKSEIENVLYLDANFRIRDIDKFFQLFYKYMTTEGLFIPRYPFHMNREWTKRDVFKIMDADSEKYWNSFQVWTSVMGFKKYTYFDQPLTDYSYFCKNPHVLNEEPNRDSFDLPEFKEHRWEQSVMSILVERYGVNCVPYLELEKCVYKVYPEELNEQKRNETPDKLLESV